MNLESVFESHDMRMISDIADEYGRVFDWFYKSWPEATIRLEVNSDQRIGRLYYKVTVLSGKEMSPKNQRHFIIESYLDHNRFTDIAFMDRYRKSVFPEITKKIETEMNEHYHKEAAKSAIQI